MKMAPLPFPTLLLFALFSNATFAFVLQPKQLTNPHQFHHGHSNEFSKLPPTKLQMANQFDVTKPVFDLYSLRSIRGDALAKYNSLNQSEPLRINIWGFLALTFFSSPWLSTELNGQSLPLAGVAAAAIAAAGCTGLFVRECGRRSKQLTRFEKELNALGLQIRLPSNQLADSPFQQPKQLAQLMNRSSKAVRLLALSGNAEQLKESLVPLRVLGRRLAQASAYVVVIPTDGSSAKDWGLSPSDRLPFVADPAYPDEWREYFESLSSEDAANNEFRWFGMSATGRSFGSGQGGSPEWLQILGQHLRPTDILDEEDPSQKDIDGVLSQQAVFYEALVGGSLPDMKAVCGPNRASQVSDVMDQGGRLDEWKSCLEEDARPAGMKTGNADVVVVSDTLAYSTIIEFPVTPGLEDATLLAVQTWTREEAKGDWKLALHQTIPWSGDRPAGGILLCDCRGCVALTKGPDRSWNLKGMIS